MANIYEKRWQNALRIANTINDLIDRGYWVFDEAGVMISWKVKILQ